MHNRCVTVCLSAWTKGARARVQGPEPNTRFNIMLHVYMFPFVHPSIYYNVFFYESVFVSVSCKCIASCWGPSRKIVCNLFQHRRQRTVPSGLGPCLSSAAWNVLNKLLLNAMECALKSYFMVGVC